MNEAETIKIKGVIANVAGALSCGNPESREKISRAALTALLQAEQRIGEAIRKDREGSPRRVSGDHWATYWLLIGADLIISREFERLGAELDGRGLAYRFEREGGSQLMRECIGRRYQTNQKG